MERTTVTRTTRSAASRIFEEIGVTPQPGNRFHEVAERLLAASELVGLRHQHQIILAQPKSEVMVQFPVEMDDGRHRLFKGYRVQHSNALGPYLGGVRFAPRLSLDSVKGHALLATLRASLARIPFGGAFGGVKVNPGELSRNELMRVTRRYCSAISHQIGPAYDVVAPEAGADGQVMAWFFDTLAQTTPEPSRQDQSRAVMGKPVELGGFGARGRVVAAGACAVLEELLGESMMELATARVSIVGFGHVGSAVAKALAMRGARITAVLTTGSALYEPGGIDVLALTQHRARTGDIDGFTAATAILERDFWSAPCELCILCGDDGCLVGDVETRRARIVTGSAQLGMCGRQMPGRHAVEHDAGPRLRQPLCHRKTEAARRSGDERGLARKVEQRASDGRHAPSSRRTKAAPALKAASLA